MRPCALSRRRLRIGGRNVTTATGKDDEMLRRATPDDAASLAWLRATSFGTRPAPEGLEARSTVVLFDHLRDGDFAGFTEAKRRCAYISRQIAKLRGHGLVAKVPRNRLYRATPYGHRVMSAAIAVHDHGFPAAYAAA